MAKDKVSGGMCSLNCTEARTKPFPHCILKVNKIPKASSVLIIGSHCVFKREKK